MLLMLGVAGVVFGNSSLLLAGDVNTATVKAGFAAPDVSTNINSVPAIPNVTIGLVSPLLKLSTSDIALLQDSGEVRVVLGIPTQTVGDIVTTVSFKNENDYMVFMQNPIIDLNTISHLVRKNNNYEVVYRPLIETLMTTTNFICGDYKVHTKVLVNGVTVVLDFASLSNVVSLSSQQQRLPPPRRPISPIKTFTCPAFPDPDSGCKVVGTTGWCNVVGDGVGINFGMCTPTLASGTNEPYWICSCVGNHRIEFGEQM